MGSDRRSARGPTVAAWLSALGLGLLVACGGQEEAAPQAAPSGAEAAAEPAEAEAEAISIAEAKGIFQSRCSSCHGPEGSGDGPASASLVPKPRNLHDPEWQSSVTDQHIEQVISYGGAAVGKSAIMPAHPDLANQPAVLAGLVAYVRSLKE